MPRLRREAVVISILGLVGWCLLLPAIDSAPWGIGWWLFVAMMVLTHLGMGEVDGIDDPGLGLPNVLSLIRAWILPLLIAASGSAVAFAGLIVAALATDGLDGRIARLTGRETRLGKQLDHAVDYMLGGLAAVLAAGQGWIPLWVAILILLRFALPVLALLVSYFWRADLPPEQAMGSDRVAGMLGAAGLIMTPFDPLRIIGIVLIVLGVVLFVVGLVRDLRPSPA